MKQIEDLALIERVRFHFKLSSGQHYIVGQDFAMVLNIPENPFAVSSAFLILRDEDREKFIIAKRRFLADPRVVFYSGNFDRIKSLR